MWNRHGKIRLHAETPELAGAIFFKIEEQARPAELIIFIDDDCRDTLVKVKNERLGYSIMHITDGGIKVERTGVADFDFEDFIAHLTQQNGPRYGLVDVKYTQEKQGAGSTPMKKLVLVMYNPDDGPVRNRMMYSTSLGSLKEVLDTPLTYQANDLDALRQATMIDFASKNDRS